MMNVSFTEILMALLAALLIWAAIVDLRTRTIPNWLNLVIAAMAPLFWWASGISFYPDAVERICGAYLIFVVFFGMFSLGGMGGGDVKMGTAIALWFAPLATFFFFILTSFAGGFVSVGACPPASRILRNTRSSIQCQSHHSTGLTATPLTNIVKCR